MTEERERRVWERIDELSEKVSKHTGLWIFMLILMGMVGGGLTYMHKTYTNKLTMLLDNQNALMINVVSYQSKHGAESEGGFKMIYENQHAIVELVKEDKLHERRLSWLESQHNKGK